MEGLAMKIHKKPVLKQAMLAEYKAACAKLEAAKAAKKILRDKILAILEQDAWAEPGPLSAKATRHLRKQLTWADLADLAGESVAAQIKELLPPKSSTYLTVRAAKPVVGADDGW